MPAERFVTQLNEQIANEFAAHQQYLAAAVHYDAATLPELAGFFYRQALAERGHALMMVRYLISQSAAVQVPGVSSPAADFDSMVEPIELALEQEKRVTDQINQLTQIARDEADFASEQFMQWFIREQVEEVAILTGLLTVARRSQPDLEAVEAYLRRGRTDDTGAGAPPQAGVD